MSEIYIISAIVLLAAGAGAGILAIYAIGTRREEKVRSLPSPRPGRLATGPRTVTGAYAYPWVTDLAGHRAQLRAKVGRVRSV